MFALVRLSLDWALVFPGGLAILSAVLSELGIECMAIATGSLREGMLYDLIGRLAEHDMRELTVRQFMRCYHVDLERFLAIGWRSIFLPAVGSRC